ncbi:hypothetical protein ACFJYZ_08330 [Enterococcus faecalis]
MGYYFLSGKTTKRDIDNVKAVEAKLMDVTARNELNKFNKMVCHLVVNKSFVITNSRPL